MYSLPYNKIKCSAHPATHVLVSLDCFAFQRFLILFTFLHFFGMAGPGISIILTDQNENYTEK